MTIPAKAMSSDTEGAVEETAVGRQIRELRRVKRMTLQELADAAGISIGYLSQIERGLRKPSAEILQSPPTTIARSPAT